MITGRTSRRRNPTSQTVIRPAHILLDNVLRRGPPQRGGAPRQTEPRVQPGVSDSMGRRLYVGNLPYSATEEQLTELFGRAGKVDNVRVMRDMATCRARGFAFVEMATDDDAQKAITEFHEHQMDGRALVVNE